MTESDIFKFTPQRTHIDLQEPFVFAVVRLAHSHCYSMCRGLIDAGAELRYVYESENELLQSFLKEFPQVKLVDDLEVLLNIDEVKLIVSAAVPSKRADIGIKSMLAGKDFFVDKAPCISQSQLKDIRKTIDSTNQKYFIYYSESIHNESSIFAKQIIERGNIGRVFHVDSLAPHFLGAENRPDWFFRREHTGGILTDLGCHQVQQLLSYTNAGTATVISARTANYNNLLTTSLLSIGTFFISFAY